MKSLILAALWGFSSLCLGQLNAAPYDPSQVTLLGSITDMTIDAGTGLLRGGTISVDGALVIVPENSLVTLPAATVAWPELFDASGKPQIPGTQTWKASVFANRVNDKLIAGLVFLAQDPARLLQGFITSIDKTTGHFTVHGTFNPGGAGGVDCVINDPLGVYGMPYTGGNSLWSVDPVNPSIHATTGFPMCIPRPGPDDPLCPTKNRPIDPVTGRASTQFRFGNPANLKPTDPDPMVMAPLVVGDYIFYTGQLIGSTFEVNGLTANVGYYTTPGTKPVYVVVDAAAYGITTPPSADPPETRAVVFTTDQTTPVQWSAEDVDRCTGEITERNIQLVTPQQNAPIGRVVYRMGTTQVIPPTRNVVFRSIAGTITTKNGLVAGEYHSPIADFIFPEITTFGANADPLAFDTFPFLVNGFGPYVPGNAIADKLVDPPIVGQLNPWPGKAAPAITPAACIAKPATPPVVPTPPAPGPDKITIISAVKTASRGGTSQVVVKAKSDNPAALLKLAVAGTNPVQASPMSKNADGSFTLSVLSKGVQTSITVTSDLGGSVSQTI